MAQEYDTSSPGLIGPARRLFTITPADADLSYDTRAIWIGGTGTLVVTDLFGNVVTISAIPAGTLLPICARRIALASTATLVVGLS